MSARFFRVFLSVVLVHLVVLSIVWVGFSAPAPRPPATFIYEGALPAGDNGNPSGDEWQKDRTIGQFAVDHPGAPNVNHWIKIRDLEKGTSLDDHLGF